MRAGAALCGALLITLCPAVPAQAETSRAAAFRIPAPDGQSVDVTSDGARVEMTVAVQEDESSPFAAAIYGTRGDLGTRRLSADLGRFGTVDLTFHPRGKPELTRFPGCRSKTRRGIFTGDASYFGETGAAPVSTTRVRGRIGTAHGCTIGFFKHRPETETRDVALTAIPRQPATAPAITFLAAHQRGLHGTAFESQQFEIEGRVLVVRYAGVIGPFDSFTFDRKLTKATVAPPAPFTGTASYRRIGHSWTGDLAVTLLGGAVSPLTGPGIRAGLTENDYTEFAR